MRWIGGLRFIGWFESNRRDSEHTVKAFVDGVLVAEAEATFWRNVGDQSEAIAAPAFDFQLPSGLADGRVKQVRIIDDAGREMNGSPCAFVAFEDGLARFLERCAEIKSETLRGELFDKLIPQSLPFEAFSEWKTTFSIPAMAQVQKLKVAVVVIGEHGLDVTLESLQLQDDCDWIAAALYENDGPATFHIDDLLKFLDGDAAAYEFVVFAISGTRLEPGALNHIASSLTAFPQAAIAYSDVAIRDENLKEWPIAFPAFDYERMLEQGYGAYFFAARLSYARNAASKHAGDLFRLFNMCLDGATLKDCLNLNADKSPAPVHAPGFLAAIPRPDPQNCSALLARATESHLKTRSISAKSVPAFGALFPAARVQRKQRRTRVSILIPTRDRVDLLRPCLESLRTTINSDHVELVVIDNDSTSLDATAYLDEIAHDNARVVHVRGPFNFSRIIAAGVSVSSGELILLLNNDIVAIKRGWLEEMLTRIEEPDVGAVGAALLFPSQVVQHGGIVLGPNFAASHAFCERIDGNPGYADLLMVAHQCSAVTAACLLTRRRLFMELGGFDGTHFPVNFNDVDFCLRLRSRGYRIVMTPHAKLIHRKSASRGYQTNAMKGHRLQGELRSLRSAWGPVLLNDPFYNPLLSLDEIPYSALAWPPRSFAPRQPLQPLANRIPPGF